MSSSNSGADREKLTSKLPASLRHELKVRAAQLGVDLQDAVTDGIVSWQTYSTPLATIDTSGADSFGTWLPEGLYDTFKVDCADRGVSYIQGLAQAVRLWLDQHADAQTAKTVQVVRRIIVANQKGGVGKTALSAGIAQAFAETGQRVLLIDYDPQGHLSHQLAIPAIDAGEESLVTHMLDRDKASKSIGQLAVPIEGDRFGGRLHVLPAAFDAFLLDAGLAMFRGPRHSVLERALAPAEADYDVIVIDSPPSLGLAMDAALYYGRQRGDEPEGRSGVVIPVEAEDSSAKAYGMLVKQINALSADYDLTLHQLGLVVNKYDSRRGFIATSSLEKWEGLGTPRVIAVNKDLREQREAVRVTLPLLEYAPESEQAHTMRKIVKELK
ncbi:ParA family protein (plasmid) [Kitasatospora sp. NBC_00070]|uniref:ParA family protein n=1 Tax=Kitasatospora sp. NBC_00070 TaxID=2975962 RepID=UPI002F91A601